MHKIHLILSPLSGKQLKQLISNYSDNDEIIYLDNVVLLDSEIFTSAIPLSSIYVDVKCENNQFMKSINKLSSDDDFKRFFAYSDMFSENLVLPAIKLVKFVRSRLDSGFIISVYGPMVFGDGLPVSGYRTKELNVGSKYLLGGFLLKTLQQVYRENNNVRFYKQRGDLFCNVHSRKTILSTLDLLSGLLLIFKIVFLKLSLNKKISKKDTKSVLYIVRVVHQIRHSFEFAKVAKDNHGKESSFLLIPQARQGGIMPIVKQFVDSNYLLFLPRVDSLLKCFSAFIKRRLSKRSIFKKAIQMEVKCGDDSFTISLNETIDELDCLLCDDIYASVTNDVISDNAKSIDKVVSFAMKGRYTTYEHYPCLVNKLEYNIVQTASLSNIKSAVFPLSNKFFVDSVVTLKSLDYGVKKNGDLVYAGCAYPVVQAESLCASRKITYFTQPYEVSTTKLFLENFAGWCVKNNFELCVKLHPRDDVSNYRSLADVSIVSPDIPIKDVIINSRLSITRTSSVILESLALGKPIIPLMLSAYDMSVNVGYLNSIRSALLYCRNENDVVKLVQDENQLIEMQCKMQDNFFDKKDVYSLVSAIYVS